MSESSPATEKKKFPLIPLIISLLLVYFVFNNPGRAWYILMVMFSFGMIIFVHELGHFLAAKSVGIKVEEFASGFDRFHTFILHGPSGASNSSRTCRCTLEKPTT